jgi:hypothetical protein
MIFDAAPIMICVAVSQAACDAVADTRHLGSVGFEAKSRRQGRALWLASSGPPSTA